MYVCLCMCGVLRPEANNSTVSGVHVCDFVGELVRFVHCYVVSMLRIVWLCVFALCRCGRLGSVKRFSIV